MIEGQIAAAMALFDPVPEAMNRGLKIYKANGNELGEAYVYLLRGGCSQVYAPATSEVVPSVRPSTGGSNHD